MMFYCPFDRCFPRLFPNIGSKIIIERGSPEDSPCLEETSYPTDRDTMTLFRVGGNNYLQLSFKLNSAISGNLASIIYKPRPAVHHQRPFGETDMPQVNQPADESQNIMGDKSPKSNQKKSSQKQAMASRADQQKKQAAAAKQTAGKNR
jgi:hypothetical protein